MGPVSATRPLLPSWSPTPIPNLSLSAGGLLALADLTTIAQRTVIAGGSSWLDALVLAPGLHYQQAADALLDQPRPSESSGSGVTAAVDGGTQARFVVSNAAVVGYLRRLWQEANETGTLTLDVGVPRDGAGREQMQKLGRVLSGFVHRRPKTMPRLVLGDQAVEMDWLSHLFYLASPLLTVTAVALMVLLADWWGLAFIIALIVSRMLNIWSIKQRARPDPLAPGPGHASPAPDDDRRTEYAVDLGNGRRAVLRGLSSDLQAVTTQTWLRGKTALDGCLEAAAKLLVYLVAAFSGNLSQAGAIVFMALLLVSAGLLGLSNAHARGLQMNGRVARLQIQQALRDRRAREGVQADGENGTRDGRPIEDLQPR
ncbi:Uncharacterized protein TPAR_00192 [Tolypocladium paradoxum]|uniref:Uncharacterized protein n=1 Tax=Tolypocladium paradoxum TaxID=94208 RepID=A0A2S4LB05_9HYPO|nr:Uncharacterized protein TPAR_00192 [Tolypocladium paradoxum]